MPTDLALKQHYTDAKQINSLMCHLLGNVSNKTVLEPSVGYGALVGGLVGNPERVDVVDVDEDALLDFSKNFNHVNTEVFHADFVDLFVERLLNASHPVRKRFYDGIISNPPYGLYFDLEYRKKIKKTFPDLYARESYGLFFAFAISRLKDGGRYVFLIPDTFLSSVNHKPLRRLICEQAAPSHIVRFPSKRFETVNFGYANLCIIAGRKDRLGDFDAVQWLDAFEGKDLDVAQLAGAASVMGHILRSEVGTGWSPAMLQDNEHQQDWQPLGDLAECRTGIYTGDNERFIGYDPTRVTRRLNGHAIVWSDKLYSDPLTEAECILGLSGTRSYVPLVRGGHRSPFDSTAWAIDWSPSAIAFYKTDKKARLQNAQFYFKAGLSVPMVSTKRISASLMQGAVFDQGAVGIFPKSLDLRNPLLLYLNSKRASESMKKIVNGSANNSANYIKRLPVPHFTAEDIAKADDIVFNARKRGDLPLSQCDEFIGNLSTTPNMTLDYSPSDNHRSSLKDQTASL